MNPAALGALLSGDVGNFMAASLPGGIEAQEAQGQRDFVASQQLPLDINTRGITREHLEKLGFRFGDAIDKVFVACQFPAGWKLKATEHSMWSDMLDDKGRKRMGIFYKAAFYDRSAHLSMTRRYSISCYDGPENGPYSVTVKDVDTVIHTAGTYAQRDYSACDALERQARTWLVDHFPEFDDPMAYWD